MHKPAIDRASDGSGRRPGMQILRQRAALPRTRQIPAAAAAALLVGCATTTVTVTPSPQAPVCDGAAAALVLWSAEWRPDQKDVPERESAAAAGLQQFLGGTRCFARSELRRLPRVGAAAVADELALTSGNFSKVVTVTVRELGPVVKLLSSPALVEGRTEVLLQVAEYSLPSRHQSRSFSVYWQSGGPGVVKGVASLPGDVHAALVAGLQPDGPTK